METCAIGFDGGTLAAVQKFQGVDFAVFRGSNESSQVVGIETRANRTYFFGLTSRPFEMVFDAKELKLTPQLYQNGIYHQLVYWKLSSLMV